jgi:hypothetical protein
VYGNGAQGTSLEKLLKIERGNFDEPFLREFTNSVLSPPSSAEQHSAI